MEAQKNQSETQKSAPVTTPVITSCWKKTQNAEATFLEDLKYHIDEFIHASMDEHKECFKKKMQKVFSMSKVTEKSSDQQQEASASN